MREIPSSFSLASPSMMSRDPDGVNLPEDYSSQLEPSGSRIENDDIANAGFVIDDFRDEREGPTGVDIKKIIGLPPPPPSGKPPKRRQVGSKTSGKDDTSSALKNKSKSTQKNVPNKTNKSFINEDCDVLCTDTSSRAPAPSGEIVQEGFDKVGNNIHKKNDIITQDELLGDNKISHEHDQSQLNSLACPEPVPSDSKILPGDIRASPTVTKKEFETSPQCTDRPHVHQLTDNTLNETKETFSSSAKSKSKGLKRTKKRGFLKKLFRGGKNHEDTVYNREMNHASSIVSIPATASKSVISKEISSTKPTFLISSEHDLEVTPVNDRPQPELTTELLNTISSEMNDPSNDRLNNNHPSTKNGQEKTFQDFCLDPPDNDNGDPPEHPGRPLLSPTASRQNKTYLNASSSDEGEQMRIETVRSRIAEIYNNHEENPVHDLKSNSFLEIKNIGFEIELSKKESNDLSDVDRTKTLDTNSPLMIQTNDVRSKDPVGVSPVLRGDKGGTTIEFGDPCGKTPEARGDTRISSSDPIGVSFCHASKTTKQFNEGVFDHTDESFDLKVVDTIISETEDVQDNVGDLTESTKNSEYASSSPTEDDSEHPEFLSSGESQFAPQLPIDQVGSQKLKREETKIDSQALATVENNTNAMIILEKVPIDIKKSGFKSESNSPIANKEHLTVSAAASTNARAIAYLHRLEGEPSPRLLWHSKKNSITPPLAENSIALAKIRAFNSKRKKGNILHANKMKSPSPHEYNATNIHVQAMMKEKNYLNHDPNKQFAPYSRFKGRRPRKKNVLKLNPKPFEITAKPVQNVSQHPLDLKSVVPSEKLTKSAVARGIKLKRIKQEGGLQLDSIIRMPVKTIQKPLGGNRFNFFPANESEIKDPIQRAGRRLLSNAAIPIQAGIRMFLSRKEAMDRVWAIVRIQSYVRRWRCETNLHVQKRSALLVQKVYRSCRVRGELKNRNACAIKIQKIVRGYLIALHAYETIFYVCRAQALARGFLVRTANIRRAKALQKQQNASFKIQNCYRYYVSRRDLASKKQLYATTIQSVWRSFSARKTIKMNTIDIIVVQSIVRRRAAIRAAGLIRKSVHSIAIKKFQALWRGFSERNKLKKSIAATKIQASWRGFQAYTDFIFVIVDILVVQRSARQWLATRKTNRLRQERAATVIQSAWRRKLAHLNLLHSLVQIIMVQSVVRLFLVKNEVKKRRDEHETNASIQRRKVLAATDIQKSWRGFWGFSHYVIVRYEITRIQALVRGKLARNKFCLKVGSATLIQAVTRRFLARKVVSKTLLDKTIVAARVLELRERNSAKHIQFWWRIVLDWMKEKKAALVIERFFLFVKSEVDRELHKIEQKRIANKIIKKKLQKGAKFDEGENLVKTAGLSIAKDLKKGMRNQREPLSRPSQKNLKKKDDEIDNAFPDHHDRGFEVANVQSPPAILHLAPSEDYSMVSNITNPSILNHLSKDLKASNTGQTNSEELYQEVRARSRSKNEKNRRLSTEDYIKKYGGVKTTPHKSLPKSSSQFFFSDDDKKLKDNKQKRQSYDGISGMSAQRQKKASMPPPKETNHFVKPMSFLTETPVTPKNLSSSGRRSGSTPRNTTNRSRSSRDKLSSEFLPPVTPTRKKLAAILRSVTSVTDCSTPTENEKMYIPPRPRLPRKHSNIHGSGGNAVMIMKTNPNYMDDTSIEEAHEIMLLGDEYGEV